MHGVSNGLMSCNIRTCCANKHAEQIMIYKAVIKGKKYLENQRSSMFEPHDK